MIAKRGRRVIEAGEEEVVESFSFGLGGSVRLILVSESRNRGCIFAHFFNDSPEGAGV